MPFNNIINDEEINSISQMESEATYSVWRDEDDYLIDWTEDSDRIKRSIDALGFPYKGAKTKLNGEIVIVDDSKEDIISSSIISAKFFILSPLKETGLQICKCTFPLYPNIPDVISFRSFLFLETKFRCS